MRWSKIFSGVTATKKKESLTAPARMSFLLKLSLPQINGMISRDQFILVRSLNFLLTSEHTLKKTSKMECFFQPEEVQDLEMTFFNNAQECANFKYKSKVQEAKLENPTGYRPSL